MTVIQGEHIADISDIATNAEMAFNADCIREAQKKVKQDQTPDSDGNYMVLNCIDCDEEIGLGRLQAAPKNFLCIYCATLAERNR